MDFLLGNSVWVYFVIFFGKLLEVSISTLRIVLINRGDRIKGSILAFFDVLIWLTITGSVLSSFGDNKLKIVVFAFAFALGNFFGSWLDSKLAFGMSSINVIINEDAIVDVILKNLRNNSFAVTVIDGQGKDGKRKLLIINVKRKYLSKAIKIVTDITSDCFISINDVSAMRGGFVRR